MDGDTRIEIFKPGTFTSVEGVTVSYSQADLQAIADAYDPALFESPLVVGHPKTEEPAYGWVDRLEMDGDRLVAVPKQIEPAFGELVTTGRFKKISAQLYPADHPYNPKPGRPYLKHVGFLGAAAPAVKGLRSLSFSEEQLAGTVTFDFPHQEPPMADPKPADPKPDPKLAEQSFAERNTALDARETALKAREEALAAEAKATRHAASLSFAEGLIAAGKLAPVGKAKVVGLLDELARLELASFGEGDAKVDLTPAAAFRSLFDGAKPVVSFTEFAKADEALTGDDADPEALATQALSFAESERQAGRTITVTQAVRHVQRQAAKG